LLVSVAARRRSRRGEIEPGFQAESGLDRDADAGGARAAMAAAAAGTELRDAAAADSFRFEKVIALRRLSPVTH
jgi:hypothetical protein